MKGGVKDEEAIKELVTGENLFTFHLRLVLKDYDQDADDDNDDNENSCDDTIGTMMTRSSLKILTMMTQSIGTMKIVIR